jgi:hypothetical protein
LLIIVTVRSSLLPESRSFVPGRMNLVIES